MVLEKEKIISRFVCDFSAHTARFVAELQYKWLGQVSDAEREHLQSRLQDDTQRFAEDFNREIQSVYFNFQIDAEDFRRRKLELFQ